jgi:DNA polymerase
MTDILALLDAALEELAPEARSSRERGRDGTGTGTPKVLNKTDIPVIPVVPVVNENILGDTTNVVHNSADGVSDRRENPPIDYIVKSTGTTGTTGTVEDFRGLERSRELFDNGNYGNSSNEISDLAKQGLFVDFETRSAVDLKVVGSSVYAESGTTDVWVACYAIGSGTVRVWYPGDPVPPDLAAHVRSGLPLIAHNAAFERTIWSKIMGPRYGWPEPALEQWHCTAAMAAAMALPRNLEDAARVTGCSFQKDMEGHRLMLQMAKPRSTQEIRCPCCGTDPGQPTSEDCLCGGDPGWRTRFIWKDDPESLKRGTEYCIRDVETERELLTQLPGLSPSERDVWLLDQRINDHGITVDLEAARNAKKIVEQHLGKLNAELSELTGGTVSAATQIARLIAWLKKQGVELSGQEEELGKEEVERLLGRDDLLPVCRQALEIRREAAKTSTSKLDAYIARTSPDGRLRESLLYLGAARTGRWAGRGAQLQNLPSRFIINKDQVEAALEMIKAGWTGEEMRPWIGTPLETVSACLRPMLMAVSGCELIGADYNAIEARGTAWLAGAERVLGVFQRGEDPYRDMAAQIYGRPAESFSKTSRERQLGKIAVLGLGYQMGADRFKRSCEKEGVAISSDEAEKIKSIYRHTNPEIVQLWRALETAAIQAVQDPERWVDVANGRIGFLKEHDRLYLRLPSGRFLIYANPRYEQADTAFGPRWGLTFDGVSSTTHRWERQHLYGGKLTENAVQAICRDLLAAALLRLDAAGYPIVLHVHDEIVAEVPEGTCDLGEFERLMAEVPEWADGFPVKAEGWRAKRFGK